MRLTAPQMLLVENNLDEYKKDLVENPKNLNKYFKLLLSNDISPNDLKYLLSFANQKNLINFNNYKTLVNYIDTKFKGPDSYLKQSDDDPGKVMCTRCKKNVDATNSTIRGVGWVCNDCSGHRPQRQSATQRQSSGDDDFDKTTDLTSSNNDDDDNVNYDIVLPSSSRF